MLVKLLCVIVTAFVFIQNSEEARILGITPFPSYSHLFLTNALLRGLAERGHEVVSVCPLPQKKSDLPNFKVIYLENIQAFPPVLNLFERLDYSAVYQLYELYGIGISTSDQILAHEKIQKIVNSPNETFDLIILNNFAGDGLLGLSHHFKAPVIGLGSFGSNSWTYDMVGNPNAASHMPYIFLGYTQNMNFWQRMANGLYNVLDIALRQFYYLPAQNQVMHKYFPDAPHLKDLLYNTSLVFVNSHFSIKPPEAHVPNMIEIGGFHVRKPKPLPADLQKYLDDSTQGAIYFSMGSNLKCEMMTEGQREAFLEIFGKLKYNILWKCNAGALSKVPKNIKLQDWYPQQDVLAHPNIRLFITHGGLLSTTEAVHYGVPLLSIPIFGDQQMNAESAVRDGYSLMLDLYNITKESLKWTLDEILENPKYTINVKKLSQLLRDQVPPPLEKAVYWTEYVMRYKGAPHMRTAAMNLTWYQYFFIDVAVFLILVTVVLYVLFYYIIKWIIRHHNKPKKIKKN